MTQRGQALIGIDGGGTSCRGAAILADGRRVEARGGPANVSRFGQAIANLEALLADLARQAGVADWRGARAHLGLAGVISADIAARVAQALPLDGPAVTGDEIVMIAGALGEGDGAVVAIGTGSFAGRQSGGRFHTLGGWGFVLGDQASGAWLGRRLLEQTLLAHDGIVAASDLTRAMLDRMGGPPGIVAFGFRAGPDEFASLAPEVVAACGGGDAVAAALMADGAAYVARALAALGWQADEPLVLAGGVGPAYGAHLAPEARAALAPARGTALDGALALARRTLGRGPS